MVNVVEKITDLLLEIDQLKWVAYGVNEIHLTPDWMVRKYQKMGDPESNSIDAIIRLLSEAMKKINNTLIDILTDNNYEM